MFSVSVVVFADSTDYKSPTTNAVGYSGFLPFDPTQAYTDDVTEGTSLDAKCTQFKNIRERGYNPDSVIYSGFGFNIPSGATIDGIEVVVSAYRGGKVEGAIFGIRISKDSGLNWTEYKGTPMLMVNDAIYNLGSSIDKWGTTWDPDSFSNTNFRLEIVPEGGKAIPLTHNGRQWMLDNVRVKIYYTMATYNRYGYGYWKNAKEWPDGYSPSIEFFSSDLTRMEIMLLEPAPGDMYVTLAHHYITACLNIENGCTPPSCVQDALKDAEAILKAFKLGDLAGGPGAPSERGKAEILKNIFETWNQG